VQELKNFRLAVDGVLLYWSEKLPILNQARAELCSFYSNKERLVLEYLNNADSFPDVLVLQSHCALQKSM